MRGAASHDDAALSTSHVDTHRAVWHASPAAPNVNDVLRFAYILTKVEIDQSSKKVLSKFSNTYSVKADGLSSGCLGYGHVRNKKGNI